MSVDMARGVRRVGPKGTHAQAYPEEAFRHLLAVERRRAARSGRSLLLLLINVKPQQGTPARIPDTIASTVFSALYLCVREVDLIGWLREERVAGAVLAQGEQPPTPDVMRLIGRRITDTLLQRVRSDIARRLHVRVLQLQPARKV
jgi:hypothetical protein